MGIPLRNSERKGNDWRNNPADINLNYMSKVKWNYDIGAGIDLSLERKDSKLEPKVSVKVITVTREKTDHSLMLTPLDSHWEKQGPVTNCH